MASVTQDLEVGLVVEAGDIPVGTGQWVDVIDLQAQLMP
jgi:hypothetical protein